MRPEDRVMTDTPIACSLGGAAFRGRAVEIAALFARALRSSKREGRQVHLVFDPAARADVEEMVRKEKICCAFLEFTFGETPAGLSLTIGVPGEGGDSADEILALFSGLKRASCACC